MPGEREGAVKNLCASHALAEAREDRIGVGSAESRGADDEPRGSVQTGTGLPSLRRVVAPAGIPTRLLAVGAQQHPCRLPPPPSLSGP